MKIAVTYDNGQVFQHFGKTENFKVYTIDNGTVKASEVINTNGNGHGALAGFLRGLGVETLICGNIGGGARAALVDSGFTLYPGVIGDADKAVEALLSDSLSFNPDAKCSHHDHEGEDHHCNCGGHHGEEHHGEHHHCGCGGHH